MNIELDEVVQDVSDEALELAAAGAQGGPVLLTSLRSRGGWCGAPVTRNVPLC